MQTASSFGAPASDFALADSVIQKGGVLVNLAHDLVLRAIRRHPNFLRLVCMMNHGGCIPELDRYVRHCYVQRRDFRVSRTREDGQKQQRAPGSKPRLFEALECIQINAEVDVSAGGFKRVEAENALADVKC